MLSSSSPFVDKPSPDEVIQATLVSRLASVVEDFTKANGLTLESDIGDKHRVAGTIAQWEKALGITFGLVDKEDEIKRRGEKWRIVYTKPRYRAYTGKPNLPKGVSAILGLDERPVARPHFSKARTTAASSYYASGVAALYKFPANLTGDDAMIGIIELGGGYNAKDLARYFASVGLNVPLVSVVSVDGATNSPVGNPNSADSEVCLDIEIAGTVAPGAKISVYFAPNTDQGFVDAIDAAASNGTMSISWGAPEEEWESSVLQTMNSALSKAAAGGTTVTVAAGDDGSTDGIGSVGTSPLPPSHVDFPASSPYVVGCGGTTLHGSGTAITSEVVWNDPSDGATGGGVSRIFPPPPWQSVANVPVQVNTGQPGRGVPDVAGDADPETGYTIVCDGQTLVIGGTSAVAPLWAALFALMGGKLGFINPSLYSFAESKGAYKDVTQGNNGAYLAGPGWDACTGWGSPVGSNLVSLITGTPSSPSAKGRRFGDVEGLEA